MSNSFRVTDKTGVKLFEASPSQVFVGANTLQVTGQVKRPGNHHSRMQRRSVGLW